MVEVTVSMKLWGRTIGLCGNLNGKPYDDLMTKSGVITNSIPTFATSWQVDGFNGT